MALSKDDLAKIQPGALVCLSFPYLNGRILTIKRARHSLTRISGILCSFLEVESEHFILYEEIIWAVSSLENVPLEDWAGLAHLLHPKLKTRVEEWLKKSNQVV